MIKIVVKYLEDRRLQSENGANLTHGLAHGAKRYCNNGVLLFSTGAVSSTYVLELRESDRIC